jgi:hypothetical protein
MMIRQKTDHPSMKWRASARRARGGPPGYAEFLQAIADPDHEEHEHLLGWCGGSFDPADPGLERLLADLDRLAKRWAPRPRQPKTPPRT